MSRGTEEDEEKSRGMSRRVLGGLRYYEEGEGGCRGVEGLRLTDGEQVETPGIPEVD